MAEGNNWEQFAGAKLDQVALKQSILDLKDAFARRDTRYAIRTSLLLRRDDNPVATGQALPAPFDRAQMIVQHFTGLLVKAANIATARLVANTPSAAVYRISTTPGKVLASVEKTAALQENYLNGLSFSLGYEEHQVLAGWDAITLGVGWYLRYPSAMGWGLPDREYLDNSDEATIKELLEKGDAVALPSKDGVRYAESGRRFMARRKQKAREQVVEGVLPMVEEHVPARHVYYQRDRVGLSHAFIEEQVPCSSFGPGSEMAKVAGYEQYGLVEKDGKIIGGTGEGLAPNDTARNKTWTFVRYFTRDETYYYVSPSGLADGGMLVYNAPYGFANGVALEPAEFRRTTSRQPEDEYVSFLEPAYALAPAYNQLETLMSSVAIYNGTARWVVQLQNGDLARDEEGNIKILDVDPMMGEAADRTDVVNGQVKQLRIEDTETLYKFLVFLQGEMDKVLPSEAYTGDAAASGPASTLDLLQQAQDANLEPAVKANARAFLNLNLTTAKFLRAQEGEEFAMLRVPGKRASDRNHRDLITIRAEDFSLNMMARQDARTVREKLIAQQQGLTLRQGINGVPVIDDEEMYDKYFGEDDPKDMMKRALGQAVFDSIMYGKPLAPGSIALAVADAVKGRILPLLASKFPLAADGLARQFAGAGGFGDGGDNTGMGGGITQAAGIQEPGMGGPVMPPSMMQTAGAAGSGMARVG